MGVSYLPTGSVSDGMGRRWRRCHWTVRHRTMRHRMPRQGVILAAGLFISLCSFVPDHAYAGCGDYLFIRDGHGRTIRASTAMAGHSGCENGNCESQQVSPPPGVPAPCNSPECRGTPVAPAPLPLPQWVSAAGRDMAVEHATDSLMHPTMEWMRLEPVSLYESQRPQSIFEPPRSY